MTCLIFRLKYFTNQQLDQIGLTIIYKSNVALLPEMAKINLINSHCGCVSSVILIFFLLDNVWPPVQWMCFLSDFNIFSS